MPSEPGNWLTLLQNFAPLLILGVIVATFMLRQRAKRTTTNSVSVSVFENIAPLEAYFVDETGYWSRLGIVCGIAFGASMAVVEFFIMRRTPNLLLSPPIGSATAGAVGGILFGVIFPVVFRRRVNKVMKALYKGESWITNSLPVEFKPSYQLPCTYTDGLLGLGGILYLNHEALLFVPHKLNRRRYEPIRMAPLTTLTAELVQPSNLKFLKLLVPRPQPKLLIKSLTGQAYFLVPQPLTTLERVDQFIANTRDKH